MNRVKQLEKIQREALQLFSQKNKDYCYSFAEFGTVGVLVRVGDKIKRCVNITRNNVALVSEEKLRDTLLDLHNYAGMALILMDEDDA